MKNLRNRGTNSVPERSGESNPQETPGMMPNVSNTGETSMHSTLAYPQSQGQGVQPQPTEFKTANDYAKAVQQWLWQYQMWNQMNWFYMTFPFYAMTCLPPNTMMGTPAFGPTTPVTATHQTGTIVPPAQRPAQRVQPAAAPRNTQPIVTG